MEQYTFSNSNIDAVSEKTSAFLSFAGVERREALRIKLIFEEVLLKYQEKFGEDAFFRIRLIKQLFSIKVEIIVEGEAYDALDKEGEEDDVIRSLLAGIGLAPTWSYKNRKNHIIFIPKKKPVSRTVKTAIAIGLAVIAGTILSIFPDEIRVGVNSYLLSPITNAFTGLISAVAEPLLCFSVIGCICSMGNIETLEQIGKKMIKIIISHMVVISIIMTVLGCFFYHLELNRGEVSSILGVFDLVYGIIPSSVFEPFVTGDALQIIFISVMVGLAMLVLSWRVNGIYQIVEQLNVIVQTIIETLCYILPVLSFFLFTGMIADGSIREVLGLWKPILIIILLMALYYTINLFRIAIIQRISPVLLWKKTMPTFMIALTTASSAAAFTTCVTDASKKFGIDKKLAEFGITLGQVMYMPAYLAMLFGIEVSFAEICNIPITIPWLFIGLITNLLVAFADPPIPGSTIMGFSIVFTQLGIPIEMMAIAIALTSILDFPVTAVQVSGWQLTLIDVADALHMIDKETLHKNN